MAITANTGNVKLNYSSTSSSGGINKIQSSKEELHRVAKQIKSNVIEQFDITDYNTQIYKFPSTSEMKDVVEQVKSMSNLEKSWRDFAGVKYVDNDNIKNVSLSSKEKVYITYENGLEVVIDSKTYKVEKMYVKDKNGYNFVYPETLLKNNIGIKDITNITTDSEGIKIECVHGCQYKYKSNQCIGVYSGDIDLTYIYKNYQNEINMSNVTKAEKITYNGKEHTVVFMNDGEQIEFDENYKIVTEKYSGQGTTNLDFDPESKMYL